MIVVDVLLVCNLLVFALCAVRGWHPGRARLDDLLSRAQVGERPADGQAMGEIVPFPAGGRELARRRARANHPAGHHPGRPAQLWHPSQPRQLVRRRHPSGGLV